MLLDFLGKTRRLAILTGAGCSTESGIPDYRSPGGVWARHKPIYFNAFVRSAEVRRFYWARSYRGWPRFDRARPNAAHRALAELESHGRVHQLITQNVDDLHQEAGSRAVVQLHGRNRVVVCIDCGAESPREQMQERLAALNAEWLAAARWDGLDADEADFAPDGDAEVAADIVGGFRVPECRRCGFQATNPERRESRPSPWPSPRRRGERGPSVASAATAGIARTRLPSPREGGERGQGEGRLSRRSCVALVSSLSVAAPPTSLRSTQVSGEAGTSSISVISGVIPSLNGKSQ